MSFSTTKTDVICPRCTSASAGTVRARRAWPLKCARPNVPERSPVVSGSVILTRNARASASTARPISATVPLTVVGAPPVPESSETDTTAPTRDLSDPRFVHADVEPEAARILHAHQRRAGCRHVAGLDHLLGDDAVEGRRDERERRGRACRLAGGACAFHAGRRGLRPGGGAGRARFGRAQRAGGVVEFLRRGRALGVQAGNAFVRRARQREGGIGRLLLGRRGGDALIGRQRGRAGASRMGGKVASVEDDQHLTRTHAIARRRHGLPGPAPECAP